MPLISAIQYVSQHLLSRPQQNDCPVRNVADRTFFNILYLKSLIFLIFFLCIKWGSHVLRRKIINIMLMKILVCELLKLFVPKHHRWEKYDFWTYFLQRSHWHTWTDLWYTRSYPQSDFSVTFFSKELSHKINCPVRDEMFRVFSRKNQFS